MTPKYTSIQERTDSSHQVDDIVKVASNGRAMREDGKFISDNELMQINANADIIREGVEDLAQLKKEAVLEEAAKSISDLERTSREQQATIEDLRAKLEASKELAADQPGKERTNDGVTEKLVKYTDGTYAWEIIAVDATNDLLPEEERADGEDSGLELKEGDNVNFKDKDGNALSGKIVEVVPLSNEDYFVYKIETPDGEIVTVSYAEVEKVTEGIVTGVVGVEGEPNDASDSYPELYARRKNLFSGEKAQERLEEEGKKTAERISNDVMAKINHFIELNPDATAEQIRQEAMTYYVEAQNALGKDILDHIDGVKVDGQEAEGRKGILRRFGAWMDRHGSTIKKGLLIAGGVGLAVTGVGLATGALTIGVALGAGTAYGAVKGTALGALLQRHGSKDSASREVDLSQSEEFKEIISRLDPVERRTYDDVSSWIMEQYNVSADKDNSKNTKRTATAAVVGGALGALAGSLQIGTPTSSEVTTSHEIPNSAPEVVSHQIAPGELSGQVLDKLLADNNINLPQFLQSHGITGYGESFALSDGSTNIGLLHAVENLGADFGIIGQTHSFAGADALSNDGIRSIFEAIRSGVDWGSHSVSTTSITSGTETNWPWTIVAAGSAFSVGQGLAKAIGDRVGRRQGATR